MRTAPSGKARPQNSSAELPNSLTLKVDGSRTIISGFMIFCMISRLFLNGNHCGGVLAMAMRQFGSGLWLWIKRLIATALLPWVLKVAVKITDWFVGDAVANKINTWASGEGVAAFFAKVIHYMADYPVRSTFFATCAVVAVSAIVAAIASWREDDRKESRSSRVPPPTQDQPPPIGEAIQEEFPLLNVDLTPSEGQGERMFLQVKNNDEQQLFHAQCRILDRRYDPNPKRLLTLDLRWERNGKRELEMRNGEICSFCVARAGEDRHSEIEWIEIVGSPESVRSQWPVGTALLPEYDVEITIFGTRKKEPYSEKFLIFAASECAIKMISFSKLKSKQSKIAGEIKVHLELMSPGLRMFWMDKTFLFFQCRVVSPVKTTSIVSVNATVETSDGKVWPCECLDDLSQWLLNPKRGEDIELESQSLIAKFRQSPLVAEVQQRGWLGVEIPLPPSQELIDAITGVTITLTDGKEEKHVTTLRPPWPSNPESLIVAKHLRKPHEEL